MSALRLATHWASDQKPAALVMSMLRSYDMSYAAARNPALVSPADRAARPLNSSKQSTSSAPSHGAPCGKTHITQQIAHWPCVAIPCGIQHPDSGLRAWAQLSSLFQTKSRKSRTATFGTLRDRAGAHATSNSECWSSRLRLSTCPMAQHPEITALGFTPGQQAWTPPAPTPWLVAGVCKTSSLVPQRGCSLLNAGYT